MQRRQFIQNLLTTSGALLGASLLTGCQSRTIDPLFLLDLLNPQIPLPDHLITPLSDFYVQNYALTSSVNLETWKLTIGGEVETPIVVTFDDILNAPQESFYLTMECIGNPSGGNLIGNAKWTGTRLLPFLEKAKIKTTAIEMAMKANDWYETTLPIEELIKPDVFLVHQMNGEPLTKEHGFPLRILIPGHFGQKQPKWLTELNAIATTRKGFWENQGWSNTAEIPTHALLRQVQTDRTWNQHNHVDLAKSGVAGWEDGVLLAGIALDRSRPITRVEVSTDGGNSWQIADQNQPLSPHEWTLWRYRWTPKDAGNYKLLARAVSDGEIQDINKHDRMNGQSGVLKIDVVLASAPTDAIR
jgi:DMSO/TMAO reductase YedYZ molybdopterin-dependent catalytic subunit